ncbi:MAG: 50S ribosomal protein L3 [Candidatus Aenigmatarchaeota archaeon]
MAKGHKPKKGSRAYWPKKRAKRMYPRLKARDTIGEVTPLFFAGYKAGMTQVSYTDNKKDSITHGQDIVEPVTIIDCPSIVVCGIKTYKRSSGCSRNVATIFSEKLAKDLGRKTFLPKKKDNKKALEDAEKDIDNLHDVRLLVHTKPKESGIGKKKPELFELHLSGEVKQKLAYAKEKLGSELKASDVFKGGDWIDVRAITKGKGYQGPVKRFGIKVRSRKNQGKRRHVGTMGAVTPSRVLPGKIAQAGQLGFQARTEYNKRVLQIGTKIEPKGGWVNYGKITGDYIIISGSVPGPKKRLIMIRKGIRVKVHRTETVELKNVFLHSQQG